MKNFLFYSAIAIGITGCAGGKLSDVLPDNRVDYKTSISGNPLEIPPDLTQSSIDDSFVVSDMTGTANASLAGYTSERSSSSKADALEQSLKNIKSNGTATWIEISEKPRTVFKNIKRFWLDNGLKLTKTDENIGIMETDWLEKETKLPGNKLAAFLKSTLSGLYDDSKRDKFRIRLDYNGDKTLVYITHYGASEEQVDSSGRIVKNSIKSRKDDSLEFTWVANERNAELEIEMLRRINLYLLRAGKKSATAATQNSDNVVFTLAKLQDETPVLVLTSSFTDAWQILGVSIDRAGYDLSSQNRSTGSVIFAKITDRKVGLILKEVERTIDTYEVGIADQGQQQLIVVKSINGKKPQPAQALTVLEAIAEVIN